MRFVKTFPVVAAGLLVALSAPAFAGQMTYTLYSQADGTSNATGPAQTVGGSGGAAFNLPTFDTTNGTLTAIILRLSSAVQAVAQVTNIGSSTANFTNSIATLPFTLSDSFGDTINSSLTAGPGAGSVGANSTVVSAYASSTYNGMANVAQANFAGYTTGAGQTVTVNFVLGSVQASGNGVPGQTFFGGYGNSADTVSVEYDFNAPVVAGVPEPASMALLGMGLLATGLVRRFGRR